MLAATKIAIHSGIANNKSKNINISKTKLEHFYTMKYYMAF